jgi:hypothetical protein
MLSERISQFPCARRGKLCSAEEASCTTEQVTDMLLRSTHPLPVRRETSCKKQTIVQCAPRESVVAYSRRPKSSGLSCKNVKYRSSHIASVICILFCVLVPLALWLVSNLSRTRVLQRMCLSPLQTVHNLCHRLPAKRNNFNLSLIPLSVLLLPWGCWLEFIRQ